MTDSSFTPRQFSLLNDEPVSHAEQDLLGAVGAASHLSSLLLDSRASTPFTLAVDAGWGMGKSSLMRLVKADLDRAPEVHTVWFNAWTAKGPDALEGLIKSVLTKFDRRSLRRMLYAATEHRALLRVARILLTLLAGPLGVSRLVDELWTSVSVDAKARNELREEIRKAAEEWMNAGWLPSRDCWWCSWTTWTAARRRPCWRSARPSRCIWTSGNSVRHRL
ncbi:hypothetical protein GXW82_13515 [Streptacidiphilus sp. 4-A2]|nr:hypothetical protein [Streptacidiphilus sp. 4-A2]